MKRSISNRSNLMKWFPLVMLLSVFSFAFSQQQKLPLHYKFHRIDHEKGLLNSIVNDIVQDSVGFVWIATDDGLYKYDGIFCKVFRHSNNFANSIPNNHVQSLFIDSAHKLWIMTDNGLCQFDYAKNQFTSFIPGVTDKAPSYKSITSMTETGDGRLYIGTYGDGINTYQDGKFSNFNGIHGMDLSPYNLANISILAIQQDSILWAGTWNDGLFRISLLTRKLQHYNSDTFNGGDLVVVNNIFIDDTLIFAATSQGLMVSDQQGRVKHILTSTNSNLTDNDLLSVAQDSEGRYWIGTRNSGLYSAGSYLELSNGNFVHFTPSEYDDGISHRTISSIFEDHQGNIWLGTHNGGVNVFDPRGEAVITYRHKSKENPPLSHQSVWGICEDHEGNLWVGTDGGGINKLNPFSNAVEIFQQKDGNANGLSDNAILSALEDKEHNLWFGTYSGGLNQLDPTSGKFRSFIHDQENANSIASNDVRVLREDKQGDIWIGLNAGGLHVFHKKNNRIERIPELQELDIRSIVFGEGEVVWLGTFGNGLVRYDHKSKTVGIFNWYADGDLNTPIILSLDMLGKDIWIGTRFSGLVKFDTEKENFNIYSEKQGLAHPDIRAVVVENENRIWTSTNIGISMFEPARELFTNFDVSMGFTHGQFNDGSGLKSQNGYLAFGSIHGLNLFYPERLLTQRTLPTVVLSDLSILNESISNIPISEKSPLDQNISVAKQLNLKYQQNTLTLHFTALDMPSANVWNYAYILEGYDMTWNEGGKQNNATYRNVPPGDYIFKIHALGVGSEDHGPTKMLAIHISPPWWGTVYAYVLYLLLAFSIIAIIYRANMRQVKLRESLYYEKKLRQQEHDLMDEKIRFYTNFSHELKTPLTLILGPAQDLLRIMANDRGKTHLLTIIHRNASLLLSLINRLLEFRKIESDKIILNCARYDLQALAIEENEYFQYQAKKKGIYLEFKKSGPIFLYFDHEKMQLVLNNLLSNAMKFTPKGHKIFFHLEKDGDYAKIVVGDTGIGIDKKSLQSIFQPFYQARNSVGKGGTGIGLALCKNLVELHGGTIAVKSKISEGTSFEVKFPLDPEVLLAQDYVQLGIPPAKKELSVLGSDPKPLSHEREKMEESIKNPLMLVVDDNEDIVHYLKSIFIDDFTVITSADGSQGIDAAVEKIPDIIISDLMMPQKSGIELCAELKSNLATSHIPIILLTAKDSSESKIDAFGGGADAYIVKPFDSEVLKARVQNLMESRKILAALFSKDKPLPRENPEVKFLEMVAAKILELNIQQNDTVPMLAQALGFSRTSLYRKIKAVSGVSINQFIRKVKIDKAAKMIKEENLNISEVAYGLGFEDLKYFRKCFKDQIGSLPSEYTDSVAKP